MNIERLKKFIRFIGRKTVLTLVVCAAVGVIWFVTETAFIYIIQLFLSSLGLIEPSKIAPWLAGHATFRFACAALIVFAIMRFFITGSRIYLAIYVQQNFIYRIRSQIFSKALQGKVLLSSHEVNSLFSDTTGNAGVMVSHISVCTVNAFAILFLAIGGFWIAPFEMAIGAIALALIVWPLKFGSTRISGLGLKMQREWERVNAQLSAAIRNKFLLKLYRMAPAEAQRGTETLRAYLDHQKLFGFLNGIITALPLLLGIFALIAITFFSRHYSHTSPGNLVAFLYIFMRLAQVGSESNTLLGYVRFYVPSVRALYKWLYGNSEDIAPRQNATTKISKISEIELREIHFGFNGKPLLSGINVRLTRGESLVITGPSGGGKSTLLSIATGLIAPTSGEVLVNGHLMRTLADDWTRRVAYVGPDPFVIDGTVRENLLFGNDRSCTDIELWRALEQVDMARPLRQVAGGLDYHLRDASRFSSGQLQRISIARALLRDFDLLIFDEGTANLDPVTSALVLRSVRQAVESRILIRVTHHPEDGDPSKRIQVGTASILTNE